MDSGKRCSFPQKNYVSTGVSDRRHTGLQQLQVLSASAQGFLGPRKQLKFIQEKSDGSSVLVGSCHRLLECLDLDGSVTQLLNETVQAQHKIFHSGTSTLMFMAGAWSQVALEAVNLGITVSQIKTAMTRALEECVEACKHSAVNISDISPPKSDAKGKEGVKLPQDLKCKLKHSRHFTSHNAQETTINKISRIAQAITHGSEASMNLVLKAYELQSMPCFDVQKLVTCTIPSMSEGQACALNGYVTSLSMEQTQLAQRLKDKVLNIALIKGDLTKKYRHLGFNTPSNSTKITDCLSSSSEEERWIENTLKTLHKLNIDIVLVNGMIDTKLMEQCTDILLLQGVKSNIFSEFSINAIPISYVGQLDERCIGQARIKSVFSWKLICVTSESSTLVSVIITSPVPAKLQRMEDEVWKCAHRLNQAITEEKLLPGAGATESICVHRLMHTLRANHEEETVVMKLMVEAWWKYIWTLERNIGEEQTSDVGGAIVYDNMSVKFEAWRRALDLVLLLLQSDTEIITGVSEGENKYNQLMTL